MRTTRAAVTSPTAQDLHSLGVTRQEGPTSNCTSKANLTSIRCHTLCCLVSAFFKIARRGLSPAATLGWRFGEYSLFLARCPKPNARTPRAKRVGPGRRGASTRRVGPRCPHSLHRSLHRIGQKRPATSIGICGPCAKLPVPARMFDAQRVVAGTSGEPPTRSRQVKSLPSFGGFRFILGVLRRAALFTTPLTTQIALG